MGAAGLRIHVRGAGNEHVNGVYTGVKEADWILRFNRGKRGDIYFRKEDGPECIVWHGQYGDNEWGLQAGWYIETYQDGDGIYCELSNDKWCLPVSGWESSTEDFSSSPGEEPMPAIEEA